MVDEFIAMVLERRPLVQASRACMSKRDWRSGADTLGYVHTCHHFTIGDGVLVSDRPGWLESDHSTELVASTTAKLVALPYSYRVLVVLFALPSFFLYHSLSSRSENRIGQVPLELHQLTVSYSLASKEKEGTDPS